MVRSVPAGRCFRGAHLTIVLKNVDGVNVNMPTIYATGLGPPEGSRDISLGENALDGPDWPRPRP